MTLTTGSELPADPASGFLDGGTLGHVIAGVVEPAGSDLLDVTDPRSGTVIARVARGTESVGRAVRLTGLLDFGTVWVNTHLVIAAEMPWVGFGASGHGRESSTLSLEDFSRTEHVMFAAPQP
jgi:hypothetical protein